MFYSRPKIEPLGWDLVDLPTPNGSRNFDGLTSDGRPVDFRFSSGWLTVEQGEAGEVLSVPISPFGVMDIYPEQICDILGLTVGGRKVSVSGLNPLSRGFDWSGRTTYWQSTHLVMDRDDVEILAKQISDAFPDSILVQPSWLWSPPRVRCRQIKFLMESDPVVKIAVAYDRTRLEKMLAVEVVPTAEFESVLEQTIDLIRDDHEYQDVTGQKFIRERGADKLNLDYDVVSQRRYRIQTEYRTEDPHAQSVMRELLAIINGYFCRGLEIVNLQTGAVIMEDLNDEEDNKSYSRSARDWCLEKPRRYLSVGVSSTFMHAPGTDGKAFVGLRPVAG